MADIILTIPTVFLLDSKGQFAGTIAYGEAQDIAVKKLENLSKK